MLSKLLKHEFRATGRIGLPLCIGMIALSVLAAIALPLLNRENVSGIVTTVSTIIIMLYMLGFFALTIGVLVVILERFYKSILRDEGYLTMTLPTSLGKILSAKLICAVVWYAIAAVICGIAVCIILMGNVQWGLVLGSISDVLRALREHLPELRGEDILWFVTLLLEALAAIVLVCLQVTLHFYAAMAVGHSFHKSKVLLSVVAFFVISWAFNAVALGGALSGLLEKFTFEGQWSVHLTIGAAAIAALIADAVLYIITHLCLKFRLNLE